MISKKTPLRGGVGRTEGLEQGASSQGGPVCSRASHSLSWMPASFCSWRHQVLPIGRCTSQGVLHVTFRAWHSLVALQKLNGGGADRGNVRSRYTQAARFRPDRPSFWVPHSAGRVEPRGCLEAGRHIRQWSPAHALSKASTVSISRPGWPWSVRDGGRRPEKKIGRCR